VLTTCLPLQESAHRRQEQENARQANLALEQQAQRVEMLRLQLSSETSRRQEEQSNLQDLQARYNALATEAGTSDRQRQAMEQVGQGRGA
jgi:hypothetical protein